MNKLLNRDKLYKFFNILNKLFLINQEHCEVFVRRYSKQYLSNQYVIIYGDQNVLKDKDYEEYTVKIKYTHYYQIVGAWYAGATWGGQVIEIGVCNLNKGFTPERFLYRESSHLSSLIGKFGNNGHTEIINLTTKKYE